MHRIDRGVEISVFLLQPGELGFELSLVFIGHVRGGRKPDGREIQGCGCPVEIIVLARRDRKRSRAAAHRTLARYFDDSLRRCASTLISWIFPAWFLTHDSLHMNFQK